MDAILKNSPQQFLLKTRQTKTNCWLQERKEKQKKCSVEEERGRKHKQQNTLSEGGGGGGGRVSTSKVEISNSFESGTFCFAFGFPCLARRWRAMKLGSPEREEFVCLLLPSSRLIRKFVCLLLPSSRLIRKFRDQYTLDKQPTSNEHQFVRSEVITAVTMKNVVFWDIKTQFVLHRRHIRSQLQSPAG
jgi:hypothetical protein